MCMVVETIWKVGKNDDIVKLFKFIEIILKF